MKEILFALRLAPVALFLIAQTGKLSDSIGTQTTAAPSGTHETMGKIFKSVATVLPYSLSPQRFEDPKNRDLILTALRDLAENSSTLEGHGSKKDEGFAFLSRSLSYDSRESYEKFQTGKFSQSRYLLQHLTDNCIACHTRLPSSDSVKADAFLASIDLVGLSALERAKLETALRQFDKAMTSYESVLLSKEQAPSLIGSSDAIVSYLIVAVQVKYDLNRAAQTLEAFSHRDEVPLYLENNVEQWISSLRVIDKRKTQSKSSIAEAKKLLAEGRKLSSFPADRRPLVYNLVASSVLHRYLESGRPTKQSAAEAYFLLGTSESILETLGHSTSNHYFKTSIRLDPSSPVARQAYLRLEESVAFEFSGSSGTSVPKDVAKELAELRRLIDQKKIGKKR